MKTVWVVESSGGRKWNPAGIWIHYTKKSAKGEAQEANHLSPGLKWRVAKYVREAK